MIVEMQSYVESYVGKHRYERQQGNIPGFKYHMIDKIKMPMN